jgi:glycosyltransferase involved in cell wall biosynthesis
MIATVPTHAGRPTTVLFIHQNFPGQFRRIAVALASDQRYRVLAVGKRGCPGVPGVRMLTYSLHRKPAAASHHYIKPFEAGVLHGQAVSRLLLKLKAAGVRPDVVIAHPGWGETLFIKDIFPDVRLVHLCEYYYHVRGTDADFDPEFPLSLDDAARIRAKNAMMLLNLESCDVAIAPTRWQKSVHPVAYHPKMHVVHEGIDTGHMCPDPDAVFSLPNGKVLHPGDSVLTYVSRNLEPYRGFHIFMRALPGILERNPDCDIVIAGGDAVSYGAGPKGGASWRAKMLAEIPSLDLSRVHFVGHIAYEDYRRLLQVSAAHIYLTYPFVLSWSMMEAMSCGCVVIGSRTAPVTELIRENENGKLVDFFDTGEITAAVTSTLRNRTRLAEMRTQARRTIVDRYSLERGIAGYRELI